jgi:hypothetical protein
MDKKILMPGAVFSLFVVSPSPVYAYIDPATGGYVMQVIIAAYAVKVFWKKIKSFLTALFKSRDISE